MAEKILIHAGFHKSGTTALQYSFDKNRKLLAKAGVRYLAGTGRAHHRPAWALTGRTWGWKDLGGEQIPAKVWENFVKRIKGVRGTALISSEFFSEANADHVSKVRRDFGSTPVHIVFTLRPFAKILASSYQQYLKYGTKIRYEQWLEEMFHNRLQSTVTPSFWQRAAVSDVLSRWIDGFGAVNISLILADEQQPEFIFDEFTRLLGIESGILTPLEVGGNRSMTAEEVELLFRVNQNFDRARGWDEYRVMVREGYVHYLADYTKAAPNSTRLLTPQWAIDEAKKMSEADLAFIKHHRLSLSGNEAAFLNPIVPVGSNAPIDSIDLDQVARLITSYDLNSIMRFPLSTIIAELKRRIRRYLRKTRRRVR